MGLYIHLVRLTEEGVRRASELEAMVAENRRIIEGFGAKVVNSYATLGRFDMVAVLEVPDDATAMELSAAIAAKGFFRPETLAAVRLTDFTKAVNE